VDRTLADLGEDRLIALFASSSLPDANLIVPNGDDAAAFVVGSDEAIVTTTDSVVEGVHFDLAYAAPRKVGRKSISVNLSDLAAMGACPRYALLSVFFPLSTPIEVATEIARGIEERCRKFGTAIIGGNSSRTTGPIVISAVLFGVAHPSLLVRRAGAQAGDDLFVTGQLGEAKAGLKLAERGPIGPEHPLYNLFQRLVDPTPRVEAGLLLAKSGYVHGMCDVSDGLGRDVRRLFQGSGLGARIESNALPLSRELKIFAAEIGASAEMIALEGGEDYELLFAAAPARGAELRVMLSSVGTSLTRIGTVTNDGEISLLTKEGRGVRLPGGFDHFGGRS
jgi:thiamine-monophosphate kinase